MDFRARMALVAVMFTAPGLTCAGINSWTGLGPDGGLVTRFAYDPTTPTTVYVAAEGGLFRSLDAGITWTLLKQDFAIPPSDVDVDPSDSNRLYVTMGTAPALYISTDGGKTLNPGSSSGGLPSVISQLEVSTDGKTLYAASGTRFFRSDDRGATWQERTAFNNFAGSTRRLLIDPTDKETVYALASTSSNTMALYETHDGGASNWTQLLTSFGGDVLYDIALSPSNPGRMWVAAGPGGLYMRSDAAHPFGAVSTVPLASRAVALAINPRDGRNVFVADELNRIFRTTDEGANWQAVTGNSVESGIMTMAVSPTSSAQRILVGGIGGIEAAAVTGSSWSVSQDGFKSTRIHTLSADPKRDRVYLSSIAGIHYVAGGGDAAVTLPGTDALRTLTGMPQSFSVSSVLAQDDGAAGRLLASASGVPAVSLDQGDHWSLSGFVGASPQNYFWSMTSTPQNPQVILAASGPSLFRSSDGGTTWAPSTSGLPAGAYADQVAFAPSDPLVAYASAVRGGPLQHYGVYRSTDGGLSWSAANTGLPTDIWSIGVDPTDAQTVYVGLTSSLWKSTNGGSSWTQMTSWQWGYISALALDPADRRIVYAAGNSVVARSVDGGATWQKLREPTAAPIWNSVAMLPDPVRTHVLLVGTQGFGVQQMMIEPDLSLTVGLLPGTPPGVLPQGVSSDFHYTVANAGPFDATDVHVDFVLSAGTQNIAVEADGGSCTTLNQTVTCRFNELRVGSPRAISLHAVPPKDLFRIVANVQGAQPDALFADNTLTTDMAVYPSSRINVSGTGPATAHVGDTVSYTITVSNAGPDVAPDFLILFDLAVGFTPGTTSGATCRVDGARIICNVGDVPVSASRTFTMNARANTAGTFTSRWSLGDYKSSILPTSDPFSVTTTVTDAPALPSSGGGGGGMSPLGLLVLGLILALRMITSRPRTAVGS